MRVALTTLGCKLNATETSAIERRFAAMGHDIVEYGQPADLLVVNTCTVTEAADVECRKVVRKGLRAAPEARVVVTGCYAQLKPDAVLSIDGVSAVVGTASKISIPEMADTIMQSPVPLRMVPPLNGQTLFAPARSSRVNTRTRAFLKVQDGCDYSCSFCTIPKARGPSRVMTLSDVRQELTAIAREGFHECVVSGINLGEYADAGGSRMIDLLHMIEAMDLPYRVRLGSIEPNTISDGIIEFLASSRTIVPHFHIPLQSGSDEILRRMRRRYNPTMYRSVVEKIIGRIPDAAVGIDVITGFPGETDHHARQTEQFLADLPWAYLHVFTYSERADTDATLMGGSVDVATRRERTRRLRQMSQQRTIEFHRANIGHVRTFLPEGYEAEYGCWTGWTENHVAVRLPGEPEMQKRPIRVRLVCEDGAALRAEVLDETSIEQPSLAEQVKT